MPFRRHACRRRDTACPVVLALAALLPVGEVELHRGVSNAAALPLALLVLAIHLVVIAFNLFGLVAVPVGGWLGWRFVRVFWWRALHVASLAAVAAQALAGRACVLTVLQDALSGAAPERAPLIMRVVDRVIFWPLPMWVFAALYVAVLLYTLALWRLVPPSRGREQPRIGRRGADGEPARAPARSRRTD